jgi:two-component system chemotaxis response regulator CheY
MPYILLIEDNQANADMTIRILESAGHTVEHSLRGFDGTRMARLIRPDLILLDLDLPDVNGRQVALVLIKQLGGQNAPPIVTVTAKSGDAEMRVASRLGFSGFVSKPFRPEDLLAVINKLLEKTVKPISEKQQDLMQNIAKPTPEKQQN